MQSRVRGGFRDCLDAVRARAVLKALQACFVELAVKITVVA